MAFTLEIETSAFKGGPVLPTSVPNFPADLTEAVARFGEDAVYAGFVKSYVIAVQAKIRAQYKAPSSGTRTKRGSALAQAENARRSAAMKMASEHAERESA